MQTSNIEAARARLAEALAGRTTRQAGRDKDLKAATWIYRWGWSSPSTVDLVASPGRRGVAARLVKKGWATRHPTPQGSGQKGVPAEVIVLTPWDGVAEVEAGLSESQLLPYPTRPDQAVPWHQLRHDGLVQLWTARKLAEGAIIGYTTPREMAGRPSRPGIKQPDAVWKKDNLNLAVELELSSKKERELHQAILAILQAVHPGSEAKAKGPFDAVAILSHSQAILDRYRRLFKPGATITTYTRDSTRHWKASGQVKVPDWIVGRVLLEQVTLW